jgi:hypothetical protein
MIRLAGRWSRKIKAPPVTAAVEDLAWCQKPSELPDSEYLRLRNVMQNGAIHIRSFFSDYDILRVLHKEIREAETEQWSQHQITTRRGSAVLSVLEQMRTFFQVEKIIETRVNIYNTPDYKPRHQDRNAFHSNAGNFTCGASFFSERPLVFTPVETSTDMFKFRQRSGDVFAFDDNVNKNFYHSVPKGNGFRVSVILWGYRSSGPLPRVIRTSCDSPSRGTISNQNSFQNLSETEDDHVKEEVHTTSK